MEGEDGEMGMGKMVNMCQYSRISLLASAVNLHSQHSKTGSIHMFMTYAAITTGMRT